MKTSLFYKRIVILVSIFLLGTILPIVGENARGILYVDDDGGPGVYTSIQDAIDAASDYDMIYVYSGVYYENPIISNKNYLTIVGEDKNTTIIDGSTGVMGFNIQDANYNSISDFTIRNAGSNGVCIRGKTNGITTNHNSFINCLVYNSTYYGVHIIDNTINRKAEYNIIENCEIYDNRLGGISILGGETSTLTYARYNQIVNSKIYSNDLYGIIISGTQHMEYCSIRSCEVFDNKDDGIRIDGGNVNDIEIRNTSSHHNQGYGLWAEGHRKTINMTCYNNTIGGIYHQDSDNLFVNCLCYNNTLYGLYASGNNNDLYYCESSNNGDYGILINGNNPSLDHCVVRKNGGYGCKIISASSSFQVHYSTFEENLEGLIIEDCSNGEITHCTIAHNNMDPLYYSSGLLLDTSTNTIVYSNRIEDNYNGILLVSSSHDNIITACTIQSNRMYGIYVINSNENQIFNNLFSNTNNVFSEFATIGNTWNTAKTSGTNIVGGPYLGGNFWSDYTGTDDDGDCLGDQPYAITGETSYDYYPLLIPPPVGFEVSGTVYYDGHQSGTIYVMCFDEFYEGAEPMNYTTLENPDDYTFYLLNGTYYLVAFMDTNENHYYDDGEPYGLAINQSYRGRIDAIQVNGSSLTNLDITLNDVYTMSGRIYYEGPDEGTIYILLIDEYPIGNTTPLEMCHIASPGEYMFFLPNGTYHVAAFMDSNNNSMFDDGEPIGLAINETLDELPGEIVIAGSDMTGIDLVLQQYRVKNLDTNKSYITIQSAIDDPFTLPGHTIYVKEGIYYENVDVSKDGINLIGENKNSTIIDSSLGYGNCISILNRDHITIKGFTLRNAQIDAEFIFPDYTGHGLLVWAWDTQQSSTGQSFDVTPEGQTTRIETDVLIDNQSFEGSWRPTGWQELPSDSEWNRENNEMFDGSYSADFDGKLPYGESGRLYTPELDCSDAESISISFYFMEDVDLNNEFSIEFWYGGTYTTFEQFGETYTEGSWHKWEATITDERYFVSDFRVCWFAYDVENGEHIYVDLVKVTKAKDDGGETANNNSISDCIICNNSIDGVRICSSDSGQSADYNRILDCEIYGNGVNSSFDGCGISLMPDRDAVTNWAWTRSNTISNCTIYNNSIGIRIGYEGEACNNSVSGCQICDNTKYGIYLWGQNGGVVHAITSNNAFYNNTIYGNGCYGICIMSKDGGDCGNNSFYHNNMLNATNNAYDQFNNIWDNGYPSGGNYWDDYTGFDSDSDGIGDTPYNISGGANQDHYPLMKPYPPVTQVYIRLPSQPVAVGSRYNITIEIDPATDVGGWKIFNLSFTPHLINAYQVYPGTDWSSFFDPGTIDNVHNRISGIQAFANDSYPTTPTIACNITIRPLYAGSCLFTIEDMRVTDSNFTIVDVVTHDAELAIRYVPCSIDEYPNHQSENVERPPSELSVTATDGDVEALNVSFLWKNHKGQWEALTSFHIPHNDTCSYSPSGNDWLWGNTTYTWSVNVTDGIFWSNTSYSFTTGGSRFDVNADKDVDFIDAGLVWVHRTSKVPYDGLYDVNGDGTVNFIDAGLTWVNRD